MNVYYFSDGVDYEAIDNRVIFVAGDYANKKRCVDVTTDDDIEDEENESFMLVITSSSVTITRNTSTIIIIDNDPGKLF